MPRILSVALLIVLAAVPVRAESPADHWAWKRPVRPPVPAGAANPIDAFIRAKLTAAGLKPAPSATREQLIRRGAFDVRTQRRVRAGCAQHLLRPWSQRGDRLLALFGRAARGDVLHEGVAQVPWHSLYKQHLGDSHVGRERLVCRVERHGILAFQDGRVASICTHIRERICACVQSRGRL